MNKIEIFLLIWIILFLISLLGPTDQLQAQQSAESFIFVCEKGSVEELKQAIHDSTDANSLSSDEFYETPLVAVTRNLKHGLEKLNTLSETSGVNIWRVLFTNLLFFGPTGLRKAEQSADDFLWICEKGSVEELKQTIRAGADVNKPSPDEFRNTPIMAVTGDPKHGLEKLKILLEAKADPNARRRGDYTALHDAVLYGYNLELIKHLLAAGADVNARASHGRTPFEEAITWSKKWSPDKHLQLLELMVSHGADLLAIEESRGEGLIARAAFNSPVTSIEFLLKKGLDVNRSLIGGRTPLLIAAQKTSDPAIVRLLLDYGADPYVQIPGMKNSCMDPFDGNQPDLQICTVPGQAALNKTPGGPQIRAMINQALKQNK